MPFATGLSVYFENPAGRVLEHPAGYAVFVYAPGKRQFGDLQALLIHTGQLLRRRQWHRLLGDQRRMTPFTEEESKWILEYWLDPANQQPRGLYAAVLLAEDVFARLATTQLINDAKAAALTYHLFDNEIAAAAWLQQC
ncbi:hypothetical protein [Hymenobacter negativus]|uniref:STAS/SEC14 domain-containing protein n=1 Tax=Hymenobacter negativus TaxID=2795026 RepID=A0ABS3QCE8_9BACT|nr:hypothetical protein [Hymenobacter negativus]MBO2008796.1 hypothetical protein [Hymenobacter negativus]